MKTETDAISLIGVEAYELRAFRGPGNYLEMAWHTAAGDRLPETLTAVAIATSEDGILSLRHAKACCLSLGKLDRHPDDVLIWNTGGIRDLNQQAERDGLWVTQRYLGHYLTLDGQPHPDAEVLLDVRLRDRRLLRDVEEALTHDP